MDFVFLFFLANREEINSSRAEMKRRRHGGGVMKYLFHSGFTQRAISS